MPGFTEATPFGLAARCAPADPNAPKAVMKCSPDDNWARILQKRMAQEDCKCIHTGMPPDPNNKYCLCGGLLWGRGKKRKKEERKTEEEEGKEVEKKKKKDQEEDKAAAEVKAAAEIKPSAQPNPLLKDKDALRACESQIFWWRREDRWRRWRQLQSRIRKHIVKEKKEKKVEAGKETKDPKDEKEKAATKEPKDKKKKAKKEQLEDCPSNPKKKTKASREDDLLAWLRGWVGVLAQDRSYSCGKMGRALGELLVELCEEELLVELCGALGGVLVEHLEAPNTFLEESAEPFEEAKTEEPSADEFEVLKKAKGEMPSNQDKPRGRRASWCRCTCGCRWRPAQKQRCQECRQLVGACCLMQGLLERDNVVLCHRCGGMSKAVRHALLKKGSEACIA